MKIKIEIAEDKSKAYAYIDTTINPQVNSINPEQIIEALEEEKVIYGIKHHILADICDEQRFDRSIAIAVVEPPGEGAPGKFRFLKPLCKKEPPPPDTNDKGEVEYATVRDGYLSYVKKGDTLVKLLPPELGPSGINVLGEETPGLPGPERSLKEVAGMGTKMDGSFLIAGQDGFVQSKERRIVITDDYEIKGPIGMATGSLDIPVDLNLTLTVLGDISSGFSAKCHRINVKGCIEDATVMAIELNVKEGIVGTANTEVKADFMHVGYINSAKTIISKHLTVKSEISGGATICGETIKALVIQGCTVYAQKAVMVNFLNGQNTIWIGIDYDAKREFDKISKELNSLKGPLEQLRNVSYSWAKRINQLKQLAQSNPNHPLLKKELPKLKAVKQKHELIEKRFKEAEAEKDTYLGKMYPEPNPFLLVSTGFAKDSSAQKVTEPDCFIHLGKSHEKVSEPGRGVYFYLDGVDIRKAWKYNIKEIKTKFESLRESDKSEPVEEKPAEKEN